MVRHVGIFCVRCVLTRRVAQITHAMPFKPGATQGARAAEKPCCVVLPGLKAGALPHSVVKVSRADLRRLYKK